MIALFLFLKNPNLRTTGCKCMQVELLEPAVKGTRNVLRSACLKTKVNKDVVVSYVSAVMGMVTHNDIVYILLHDSFTLVQKLNSGKKLKPLEPNYEECVILPCAASKILLLSLE